MENVEFFINGELYTKVNNGPYKGSISKYCKDCDDNFPWIKGKEESCPYCKDKEWLND